MIIFREPTKKKIILYEKKMKKLSIGRAMAFWNSIHLFFIPYLEKS